MCKSVFDNRKSWLMLIQQHVGIHWINVYACTFINNICLLFRTRGVRRMLSYTKYHNLWRWWEVVLWLLLYKSGKHLLLWQQFLAGSRGGPTPFLHWLVTGLCVGTYCCIDWDSGSVHRMLHLLLQSLLWQKEGNHHCPGRTARCRDYSGCPATDDHDESCWLRTCWLPTISLQRWIRPAMNCGQRTTNIDYIIHYHEHF